MKTSTKENIEAERYKTLRSRNGRFAKSSKEEIKCRFCDSSNVVKYGYNLTKKGKAAI